MHNPPFRPTVGPHTLAGTDYRTPAAMAAMVAEGGAGKGGSGKKKKMPGLEAIQAVGRPKADRDEDTHDETVPRDAAERQAPHRRSAYMYHQL